MGVRGGLYSDKTHEWAATAAKLVVINKSSEVIRDLMTMPKKKALVHVACLLGYHTEYLDREGSYHKFQRALQKASL